MVDNKIMYKRSNNNVQCALFYSQITFAMNAARVIRSLAMNRNYNRTERELITYAQCAMVINAAKIWDRTGYNIEKYVIRSDAEKNEKEKLLQKIIVLKKDHGETILNLKKWRNKLIAHLDNDMTTLLFSEFDGDIADIQKMLQDVASLVSNTSWYPEKNRPMKFLDYTQIEKELRI